MNLQNKFSLNFFWCLLLVSVVAAGCESFGGGINPGDLADLNQLSGDWIRVESNNPSSDFMKIKVTGSTGTLTDKAGSGFSNGDEKWANITPDGQETFTYQELGSDYNYYDATITLISENELRISVVSSGAGNDQKWLRDDGSIVNTEPTLLDCNISAETVLANTPAPVDYIVECVIDITDKLTIEPGVVIEFAENAGLGIYDAGAINAIGTASEPIVFKGENAVQGYWRGIHTETNTINNRLEFVRIEDAGSNYVYCCNEAAALFVKDGKMVLKNSTISNSGAYGLVVRNSAELPEFEKNTFSDNKEEPILLSFEDAGSLDGTGSTFTGNGSNYILLYTSDVVAETSVPANSIPYLLEGEIYDIKKGLTLEAGVQIEAKENAGIGVFDEGYLRVDGTSGSPVVIRGTEATRGFWRGIHIETSSSNNKLNYLKVSDAGSNYVYCCNEFATLFLKGAKIDITNSTFSNGEKYGIYANDDAEFRSYSNNTIETHSLYPLNIAADRAGELDGTNSSYLNNDNNFVNIHNSDILQVSTWSNTGIPYYIAGYVLDVKQGLTISPGAQVTFGDNAGLGIYDSGYLNATGTAAEKIVFQGWENIKGYWRGIHSETTSNNNVMAHVELKNAGSNYVYCCNDKAGLLVKDGTFKVSNSFIGDNDGCGITVKSAGTLTESGNTFSNNTDGNICN